MTMSYHIHCPVLIDLDFEMYDWNLEFRFDDGTVDFYVIYSTTREMINWVCDDFENRPFIARTSIWQGLNYWGEVERV